MDPRTIASIEQLVLSSLRDGCRTIGLTAPTMGSGVNGIALLAAFAAAQSGRSTILLDLTKAVESAPENGGWIPGQNSIGRYIKKLPRGVDYIRPTPTRDIESLYRNEMVLRELIAHELQEYECVVLTLPALSFSSDERISPLAAAVACDCVFLVCVRGQVNGEQVRSAADAVRTAGGNLRGVILNEVFFITPGIAIAKAARQRFRRFPKLSNWIAEKASKSTLLNESPVASSDLRLSSPPPQMVRPGSGTRPRRVIPVRQIAALALLIIASVAFIYVEMLSS